MFFVWPFFSLLGGEDLTFNLQGEDQADLVLRILEELPIIDVDVKDIFIKATLDLVEIYLTQVLYSIYKARSQKN